MFRSAPSSSPAVGASAPPAASYRFEIALGGDARRAEVRCAPPSSPSCRARRRRSRPPAARSTRPASVAPVGGDIEVDDRGERSEAHDGVVQASAGEQCDDSQNDGGYGECAAGCRLGTLAAATGAAGERGLRRRGPQPAARPAGARAGSTEPVGLAQTLRSGVAPAGSQRPAELDLAHLRGADTRGRVTRPPASASGAPTR